MKNIILTVFSFLYLSSFCHAQEGYQNPVIPGFHPDPSVCRVGDDYYLVNSTFEYFPGVPLFHSKDLIHWQQLGNVLTRPSQLNLQKAGSSGGIYAPTIRYHEGTFYMITTNVTDKGNFLVHTKDPAGEWEKPVLVKAGKGMIDPAPLWDEDGHVYLVHAWAGSRSKMNSIVVVCEMNAEGTRVISNPVLVYDGNDGVNHTVEGPKLYKRNGYYYIFAPAGGVATGWQLVLRSKNIYGPYESKIVMAQGKTNINGPHQGGWVDTNTGESWFVHFQDKGAYGRVIHLNPMTWVNDWPVIGVDKDEDGCGEPVTTYKKPNVGKTYPIATPPESDEFNTRHLGLQWQWHANKKDTYGFTTDLGFIRLYAGSLSKEFVNFWEVPNLLMQKFPAEEFTATTKLTFTAKQDGEQTGIIVMGWDYSYLSIRKEGDQFILQQAVCKDAEQQNPEQIKELANIPVKYLKMPGVADNEWQTVYLQVKVRKGAVCTFAYSLDGKKYTTVGEPFTARQGKWIGAKVGVFCVTPNEGNRGWADVDWFRMTK